MKGWSLNSLVQILGKMVWEVRNKAQGKQELNQLSPLEMLAAIQDTLPRRASRPGSRHLGRRVVQDQLKKGLFVFFLLAELLLICKISPRRV